MPFASLLQGGVNRSSLPEMCFRLLCVFCSLAVAPVAAAAGREPGEKSGAASRREAVATRGRPVWVASNGFHSAFVLRVGDLSPELRQLLRDRHAQWAVVGWGDKQFFMAKPPTIWMAVQAVCWPTPSALHVMPLRRPPEQALAHSDLVRLALPAPAMARLRAYLDSQFARSREGRHIPLGPGFARSSEFFLGAESFYFPKMCNVWTARGLRHAGVRIASPLAITAGGLTWQLEGSGRRTGSRRRPVDAF